MAIPNPNPNIADGLIVDNKTLSSAKIKTIIDALIEMESNAIGAVDSKFNYSTDEVEVGTWINDKTIYRKTVTLTGQTVPKNDALTILVSDLVTGVDTLIDCKIIADISNDKLILPYSYGASAYTAFITEVAASASSIVISRGNSADLLADLIITLTYTKTS